MMTKCIFFLVTTFILATGAFGQPAKSDLEKQRAAIQREIDDVKASFKRDKKK